MKKYFLPVYYVWAVLSPSLILWVNPVASERIIAFYALFGLIWPLSFVVYPDFLLSIQQNETNVDLFGLSFSAEPIFYLAWLGPILHLIFAFVFHKNFVQLHSDNEKLTWGSYFSGYL